MFLLSLSIGKIQKNVEPFTTALQNLNTFTNRDSDTTILRSEISFFPATAINNLDPTGIAIQINSRKDWLGLYNDIYRPAYL